MTDFALTDRLDLKVENGIIGSQNNGETTLLCAFLTDARIRNRRGHWSNVRSSTLWRYEQARLTNQVATDVTEDARSVANELVADGLFERIETEAMVRDNMMQLNIRCYNQNDILVVNRTFII